MPQAGHQRRRYVLCHQRPLTRNTYLYSFRLTEDGKIGELTKVGKTGFKANYLQSMAFDHSTGELFRHSSRGASSWARPTYKLVKLDLETGVGTALPPICPAK